METTETGVPLMKITRREEYRMVRNNRKRGVIEKEERRDCVE